MNTLRVEMLDETGAVLQSKNYDLATNLDNLSSIESHVENLRPQILTDITHKLLSEQQEEHKKKRST